MYGYHEGDVVYIKFMKFANSNTIDCRVKGRPYLIYKIKDEKFYLLKIGSSKVLPEYFSHMVSLIIKGKDTKRKCYVDMKYIIVVDADKLLSAIDSMFYNDNTFHKKGKHSSKISKDNLKMISNQMKILEKMKEIKIIDKNNDNVFNQ